MYQPQGLTSEMEDGLLDDRILVPSDSYMRVLIRDGKTLTDRTGNISQARR